ncbi:MAG: amidohydrolase family protein [Chitinophagales bacterium]
MNKIFFTIYLIFVFNEVFAQRIEPVPAQERAILITGATIHTGNGQLIENGTVIFDKGIIIYAGPSANATAVNNGKTISATGKHIYPGIIAANTYVGLSEIEAARATNDYNETGEYNPGIRSLIAYNTDSKAIPTIRSNGILLAQSVPQGSIISGTSSVMQLDAWNWEDAAYKADDGIHIIWPSFFKFDFHDNSGSLTLNEDYEKQVTQLRQYFSLAKSYNDATSHLQRNINFEAMQGLFDSSKTLFVHCDYVREIINAVHFAGSFKTHLVITGGRDSYLCTELLKEKSVAVILGNIHSLPAGDDVEINIPFQTAALLNKAGVMYCLSLGGFWQQRNLPFIAGTTVAYGISREDALKSITSSAANILRIDDRTGTIEAGKDANIIISDGDLLDMKTNNITHAFIQGREINLDNSQKQLYEIYMKKYGLK